MSYVLTLSCPDRPGIVFAVSGLLLAVQIASGQLTPRIISLVFARPMLRISVGVFVFAYAFTLAALGRIERVRIDALALQRAQHALSGHQRHRAFGGAAAKQHADFAEFLSAVFCVHD